MMNITGYQTSQIRRIGEQLNLNPTQRDRLLLFIASLGIEEGKQDYVLNMLDARYRKGCKNQDR